MLYLKSGQISLIKLWLAAFFTWLPIFGVILFDIFVVELYHQTAFRLLGIPLFKRSDYILVMDRQKLEYLTWYQKLGCMYCGYVNGLAAYFKAIVNLSEKHWCGIMHQGKPGFKNLDHQINQDFAKFGDQKDFEEKYIDSIQTKNLK